MKSSVVDLFCGIGGLTHGLQRAGLTVTAGIDIDKSCRFAYEKNNKSTFLLRDIVSLDADELKNIYPQNTIKILVGCAPCQPFSTYSLRYKKTGKNDDKWKLIYFFLTW